MAQLLTEVSTHLGLIVSSLPPVNDEKTIAEYKRVLLRSLDSQPDSQATEVGIALVEAWARIQQALLVLPKSQHFSIPDTLKFINELKSQKQTAQRTTAWYEQGKRILTASEIYSLFRAPRARAQMVFSKVETIYRSSQNHAVTSDRMSAFDWGIRFEPVVKQIFEHRHKCQIEELGRIMHPTDPRIAASPDGLISAGPDHLLGHLIEIKAPVTREIGLGVPDEYYAQMQTQLEVTCAKACEYIEMKFSSPYNTAPANFQSSTGPFEYSGFIYLIKTPAQTSEDNIFAEDTLSYVYGPVNSQEQPELPAGASIVEVIPWYCVGWSHHVIPRREDWWHSIQPAINKFWEDVEGARNGTFIMPESTRQKKQTSSPSSTGQPTSEQSAQDDTPQSPTPGME
jgi:hypothetical protein